MSMDFTDIELENEPEPSEPPWENASDTVPSAGEPNDTLLNEEKRTRRAEKYEKKAQRPLRYAFAIAVQHPLTVPDSAAILEYGPNLAEKIGDLADHDAKVRKAVDFLSDDTLGNPYLACVAAAVPLVMQILRNHEPQLVPEVRGIRIPFIKRTIKLRFGIKLGRLRAVTKPPQEFGEKYFNSPKIVEKMQSLGITVPEMSDDN